MKKPDLDEVAAYLRRNRHTAMLVTVTTLVVALSAWTSWSALKVAKQARAGIEEAVAIRSTALRFSQQFVPATTGETDEWARTTHEAGEFGTAEALKVSLAQTVSRIGEVAGMSGVKASFAGVDSTGSPGPRIIGELTFQPASFGLRLEGSGSVSAVSRVILRLPPTTEIMSLALGGDTDAPKATFQLAVYQSPGGPQN